MERYVEYKDSGVEWIGEIPVGWEVVPIKYLSSCNDDALSEDTDADFDFDYVDISSVTPGSIEHKEHMRFENAPSRARRLVQTDDVIISTVRTYLKAIAPIGQADSNCVVSTGFAVLRPHSIDSDFFKYALMDDGFTSAVEARSVGISYPAINASELVTLPIAVPNADEQRAIAAWLDEKTGEVDGLVADTERSIELLEEYRRSVISEAVTKGLDPNVPMKDSGIEWIGEIPAHWEVVRITNVATRKSGHTPDKKVAEYWDNGDIVWISLADSPKLRAQRYVSSSESMTNAEGIAHSSAEVIPSGAVLLSRDASIGLCAIAGCDLAVSQHFMAYICGERISNEYLLDVFHAMSQELEKLSMGSTIPTIGLPLIRDLVTPLPPLEEQLAIENALKEETAAIDALIADKQAYVERLREYRKSLVSEAVTGKFKVPGVE